MQSAEPLPAVPPVLALADERADRATAGGKGASLARLARAGLQVPDGFHVTAGAYRSFLRAHGLQPGILAALRHDDAEASAAIARLFAAHPLPQVAVRSSAATEDLPGMSAAGQQDTFLGVAGAENVLAAVRCCWASLWTERAIAYCRRH